MTEGLDFNTIFEVTDDKVTINLLLNLKYRVILVDPVSHIWSKPYYTSLVFHETNVRY